MSKSLIWLIINHSRMDVLFTCGSLRPLLFQSNTLRLRSSFKPNYLPVVRQITLSFLLDFILLAFNALLSYYICFSWLAMQGIYPDVLFGLFAAIQTIYLSLGVHQLFYLELH
jgi:hypothetical protein